MHSDAWAATCEGVFSYVFMKHMKVVQRLLYISLHAVLVAVIFHIAYCFIQYARSAPPTFDGAMNLNVAVSFLQGRGYGFVYDSFYPFPAQTDGPFILPAALVLWLGGITPLTTQLVSLLYLLAFAMAAYILLRCMSVPPWISLIGVILCLRTPGMKEGAINGLGEIPCLFFFLAGLILIVQGLRGHTSRSVLFLSGGMAWGLSVITKITAFIMVGPALFLLGIYCCAVRDWKPATCGLAGFTLPVLGWELFRYIQVGNISNYLSWWRLQLLQAHVQSGLYESLAGPANVFGKAAEHIKKLDIMIGLPPLLLLALIAVMIAISIFQGFRLWKEGEHANLYILATFLSIIMAYFTWWLFLIPTNMAWLRRLMDGLILMMIFSIAIVYFLGRVVILSSARRSLSKKIIIIIVMCVILISQMKMARHGGIFTNEPKIPPEEIEQIAVAEKLKQLPGHAVIFGFGWWKAPVLMLFSGRQIMNFKRWAPSDINALPDKYLVLDRSAKAWALETQDIIDMMTSQVVHNTPNAALYRILKVSPYKPFSTAERAGMDIASGFDAVKDNYKYVRGLYFNEGTCRWSMPEAGFLLRRSEQNLLRITLTIPDELYQTQARPRDLHIDVYSKGCINRRISLAAGRQTLDIPLTCPVSKKPAVMEVSVAVNAHLPFIQQIDFDMPRVGFLFESARLLHAR